MKSNNRFLRDLPEKLETLDLPEREETGERLDLLVLSVRLV